MWQNYETNYGAALKDNSFLAWREAGARQKALNIVRICSSIKVRSVIEIGCGTGAVLRFLHSMRFAEEYTCIDVAVAAIQFVQQSCGNFTKHAFVGSATALPFQDAIFDVGILSHVVEHLEDPVSAMREASRVARYVVVEVPTEKVLSNAFRRKVLRLPYASIAGAGHLHFWSPRSIGSFLTKDCGLQILNEQRDLISKEIEFFGKEGLDRAKPLLKQALKSVLPATLYSRLLTTHATFLCSKPGPEGGDGVGLRWTASTGSQTRGQRRVHS